MTESDPFREHVLARGIVPAPLAPLIDRPEDWPTEPDPPGYAFLYRALNSRMLALWPDGNVPAGEDGKFRRELVSNFQTGALAVSYMDPKTGALVAVPASRWNVAAAEMLETAVAWQKATHWSSSPVLGWLYLADVAADETDRGVNAPAPRQKDSRGRRAKFDWQGALIELSSLDAEEGTANKTQADLIRHLLEWFAAANLYPAKSAVQTCVKRFQTEGPNRNLPDQK